MMAVRSGGGGVKDNSIITTVFITSVYARLVLPIVKKYVLGQPNII